MYEELKRLRDMANQGLPETELQRRAQYEIEHEQRPARQVHNYRWRIELDYYGYWEQH